jgi:hypothetical protein
VAPNVEAGLVQVSFTLAVFGVAADQASLTLSDLTALAAVTGAAFAACAGAISDTATTAETMLANKRLETFTCSAYCSNLGKT